MPAAIEGGTGAAASFLTNGIPYSLPQATYDETHNAWVTGISPRYGTVEGGTVVVFSLGTSSSFALANSQVSVFIDDVACNLAVYMPADPPAVPDGRPTDQIQCTTGERLGVYESDPTLEIWVDGNRVASNGHQFRYVQLWSSSSTWGASSPPVPGESVSVTKGTTLLVDVDDVGVLDLVVIDGGAIIFPCNSTELSHLPSQDAEVDENGNGWGSEDRPWKTFQAHYIFINGGTFEVGTEDEPYECQLDIVLHGAKYDPSIPIYGNKGIFVRRGTLDLHGRVRGPSWTTLSQTASPGDTTITVGEGLPTLEWKAGDDVFITQTDTLDSTSSATEIACIQSVAQVGGAWVLTLEAPLTSFHYGESASYEYRHPDDLPSADPIGTCTANLVAEVGLLTRNVRIGGIDDVPSHEAKYGAHLMLHSPGDETSIGRIEGVQFRHVGQAAMKGRYAINFHQLGVCHKSYVRSNSIWLSYNRGIAIHGVHNLRV